MSSPQATSAPKKPKSGGELGVGEVADARGEGRLRRAAHPDRHQSRPDRKLQNRTHPWALGDPVGRLGGAGGGAEAAGRGHIDQRTHPHQPDRPDDGKYFINPGSATGAYSSINSAPKPSFILIAVQGDEVVAFIYELINEEINVQRVECSKKK
eukprot:CAMPEP_0170543222 /NCGR_PEP_ID=MMETSP0211-20121228/2412_1 /TAXON_ID=311385 /ORGANISM="Pseudokeronopsis sp., Strain OXSARD2" /LENGTH=153 /DNA_ID=CAMNT_0010846545 /DNA_START=122 /DNA_END=585 /DNA_ORIENTATION=+